MNVISPETRMMVLPYGDEIMIVGRTMWTQSTSVTDGRTDRQTELGSQRPCNAERRTVKGDVFYIDSSCVLRNRPRELWSTNSRDLEVRLDPLKCTFWGYYISAGPQGVLRPDIFTRARDYQQTKAT